MITIANYLYAAVSSGFYSKKEWQEWADKQILSKEHIEEWIYHVSLATDVADLSKILSDIMIDENYYKYNESSVTDAVVGYYYIQYLENKISLYDLIEKSGQASDASGQCSIDCEEFYIILNELDSNEDLINDTGFLDSIYKLFKTFGNVAKQQLKSIEEY